MKHSHLVSRILAASLLAASLLSVTALAAPAGVDSATAIRVRKASSTTSAIDAVSGTESPVTVDPDQAQGSFEVVYQDENGGETSATITAVDPAEMVYAYISADGDGLRVRQGPGTGYPILCTVADGLSFPITGKTNGWYQITCNGRTGYVYADYVVVKTAADLDKENNGGSTILPPADFDGELAQRIVNYALQFEGYPYVYATAGPDTFDCSGFTSYVYKQFGYTLNRCSKDQLYNGVPVSKAELQPADILLFSRDGTVVTHVGLYIGNGQFIHASTSTTGVIISDLNSNYYVAHYFAARRII